MKSKKYKRQQVPTLSQTPNEFDLLAESVTDVGLHTKSMHRRCHMANDPSHGAIDKDSSQLSYLSTVVTECLDLHERCTGSYTDNLEKHILRCCCLCHKGKDVVNSPPETNHPADNHEGGGREGGGLR